MAATTNPRKAVRSEAIPPIAASLGTFPGTGLGIGAVHVSAFAANAVDAAHITAIMAILCAAMFLSDDDNVNVYILL